MKMKKPGTFSMVSFTSVSVCLQLINTYRRALYTSQMDSQKHQQEDQQFNMYQHFTSCIIFTSMYWMVLVLKVPHQQMIVQYDQI